MVWYLGFTVIITYKILFKHLTEQIFSVHNMIYKNLIYDQNASFPQRSHKSCILLKWNIHNEQKIFEYSFESILLITKPFQTTETWENLTKGHKSL